MVSNRGIIQDPIAVSSIQLNPIMNQKDIQHNHRMAYRRGG